MNKAPLEALFLLSASIEFNVCPRLSQVEAMHDKVAFSLSAPGIFKAFADVAHFRILLRIAAVALVAAYLARLSSLSSQSCCSVKSIHPSPFADPLNPVTITPPTQQVGFQGWWGCGFWVVISIPRQYQQIAEE
jgi:hypothetical protein